MNEKKTWLKVQMTGEERSSLHTPSTWQDIQHFCVFVTEFLNVTPARSVSPVTSPVHDVHSKHGLGLSLLLRCQFSVSVGYKISWSDSEMTTNSCQPPQPQLWPILWLTVGVVIQHGGYLQPASLVAPVRVCLTIITEQVLGSCHSITRSVLSSHFVC